MKSTDRARASRERKAKSGMKRVEFWASPKTAAELCLFMEHYGRSRDEALSQAIYWAYSDTGRPWE